MKIKTITLSILTLVILFGGILAAQLLGWWKTTSTKEAAIISTGSFAGSADPADIRGSYTFNDVARNFNIPLRVIADAFLVPESEAAAFKLKDLESKSSLYGDLSVGTSSVRAFVAFYLGMEGSVTVFDSIPPSAIEIILERGSPTAAQQAELAAMGAS